jgi:outer membrane receptor protein involved in Fe transport
MRIRVLTLLFSVLLASPAFAGDLWGRVIDRTGGVLPGAAVRLLNLATAETAAEFADLSGEFTFDDLQPGSYLVTVSFDGFSEASRTIVVETSADAMRADFTLEIGTLRQEVTVAAARGARDIKVIPLRADTLTAETLRELAPVSTGAALIQAPGVTPVGSGPYQMRPRLRGLDSTRVLVLVNGERLNNARTATDRSGIEVGLIDISSIEVIEVLGGAGSVLYGTDALAGTINIITNQPRLSDTLQFTAGFDGFYSSNEDGRRGSVNLGIADTRWAVRFVGGVERYDNYSAGGNFSESSQALLDDGTIVQNDTADQLGFTFGAFPEPFNAPFTRTRALVPQSGMEGSSADLAVRAHIAPGQELEVRYQRRRTENIGFPDFEDPFFFQAITLPWSRFDKFSASYAFVDLAPWLPRLTARAYIQRQDRALRNRFPVQFPAPSARFFPVSIFRLDIDSQTRQQVTTPGVDVQANIQVRPNNLLTAGVTLYRDRSTDGRVVTTTMSMLGAIELGRFGPEAVVFPSPVALGPPTTDHPVRVPNASLRDLGFFVLDEWDATPSVRVTGGLRLDAYRVTNDPTPGYEIDALVEGAAPAIDPATLPDVGGSHINRTALTGEAGVVIWAERPVSLFAHYVRSYRHPNLEELLFSGPATVGNIVPNIQVQPETGHNFDIGTRMRTRHLSASAVYFTNRYDNFISTEVVAESPAGSLSQAINFAKVHIQGVEVEVNAPFAAARLHWLPRGSVALTRGTVIEGTSPLTGVSLDGSPQDNITPSKVMAGLRVSDPLDRWWASYDVRSQAEVARVSPLLLDSPFLIAQDLLALDGFTVHRIAVGYNFRYGGDRLGLTLAIDNLTDQFYREHYQFAPARGRSVTVAVTVGGVR